MSEKKAEPPALFFKGDTCMLNPVLCGFGRGQAAAGYLQKRNKKFMEVMISWKTFLLTSGVIGGIYYVLLALVYHKDLKRVLSGAYQRKNNNQRGNDNMFSSSLQPSLSEDNEGFQQERQAPYNPEATVAVHEFVDELNAFMNQAGREEIGRERLISSLRELLIKYPDLYQSGLRQEIISLIQVECEVKCKVHLDAEELALLW